MAEKTKELHVEEMLKKVSGGLIATFKYKCPICGATEEGVIDTNSHSGPRGGDGWCDKCNVKMDTTEIRY